MWLFLLAFPVCFLLTPAACRLAMWIGAYDVPTSKLKIHRQPVPYLGGAAIALSTWVPVAFFADRRASLLLIPSAGAFLLGLWDDAWDLAPKRRLAVQVLLGVALFLLSLHLLSGQHAGLKPTAAPWPVLLLLCVAIPLAAINSVNLIDGLDGLAAGTAAVSATGFWLLSSLNGDAWSQALALALFGACMGFLVYNFRPASIFMGDNGSYSLGFLLSILFVRSLLAQPQVQNLLSSALLMGIFAFDTSLAILRRFLNGKPLFVGDRSHFYDQLRDRGFSTAGTVLTCYGLNAAFGAIALGIRH